MKKGFTLIELLAVIVVLAIIALIALPIITGVVNKARLNSLKSSAYGLVDASTLYQAQYGMGNYRFDIENNKVTSQDTTNMIKYKGTIKEGTVIINHNKITICITDGKNSAYKNYNETKVTLVSKKTCSVPTNTNIVYLDNEATLTELSNQELTERLLALEEENKTLKTKVTALENNSSTNSDIEELNSKLNILQNNMSSNNSSLLSKITQNQSDITDINNNLYEIHKVYSSAAYQATTSYSYTGISVTIPANSYYALNGHGAYNYGPITGVALSNRNDYLYSICVNEFTDGLNHWRGCSAVGYTGNASETFYLWVKHSVASSNPGSISGFYIKKK